MNLEKVLPRALTYTIGGTAHKRIVKPTQHHGAIFRCNENRRIAPSTTVNFYRNRYEGLSPLPAMRTGLMLVLHLLLTLNNTVTATIR